MSLGLKYSPEARHQYCGGGLCRLWFFLDWAEFLPTRLVFIATVPRPALISQVRPFKRDLAKVLLESDNGLTPLGGGGGADLEELLKTSFPDNLCLSLWGGNQSCLCNSY